jgi:protocatechuate 3,4-dioxygenase beta subunit
MKLSFLKIILILFSVFFATSAWAQSSGVPQEKCGIAGTVIDAVSEQPLKGAEVRLRAIPATSAPGSQPVSQSIPQTNSASTDANGRFLFESISPGRYFILASRDGYVNNSRPDAGLRGKWIVLGSGQHLNDIVIRLLPNGAIAGRIADEMGKPLRGISVEAMKSSYAHGRRELHAVATAQSSGSGEYRIQALVPGKYYVRAKPPASLKAKPGSDKAYVPIYYPAANDQSHSVVLVLRAGEDLAGIDMNLAPVRTVHIRGRVINARTSTPSNEAEVTLLSDQGETIFSPSQNFSAGGQAAFEFQRVPPGSYVLVAQQPSSPREPKTMWGRTSMEVKDTNIEHADVVVGPGVDVSGRIRVEDNRVGDITKDLTNMVGILESQEPSSLAGLTPDMDNASVKPDGSYTFREVPEGSYHINFFPVPAGFYLRSSGSADVLETGIAVGRGHSPPPFELILSPGAGRIDGTVGSDEQSASGASVVLVPDGKGRGQSNDYRQATTDLAGRFALRNIPPGDYTLFAWEQIDRGAYFDPELLARYEDRGKAVHVEEGGHISMKLELIPAAETAP